MTDDRSLERSARSWIETGPTKAPDRAVEAALLRVQTTSQERDLRVPWRAQGMLTNRLAVVAAAVLVVAGALTFTRLAADSGPAAPASSPPSASAQASPSDNSALDRVDSRGWLVFSSFQRPDADGPLVSPGDMSEGSRIWLVKPDGSGLHELAPGLPVDGKGPFDISPDGQRVVFESRHDRLWEVAISGGEPTPLSPECVHPGGPCDSDAAFSPDGHEIAFVHTDQSEVTPTQVIAIKDLETGTVEVIEATREPLHSSGSLVHPSWSPDGSQIAYVRFYEGTNLEGVLRIYVVRRDGTGLKELPAPAGVVVYPEWSPDGSRILFSTYGVGGGIFTIRPDGSGLTTLCAACSDAFYPPSWTPDGMSILFWSHGTWALMDRDGGHQAYLNQQALTFQGIQVQSHDTFARLEPIR